LDDAALSPESPRARRIILALSIVMIAGVAAVIYLGPGGGAGAPGVLPTLNAVLNASASIFLIAGYSFIRKKQVSAHKRSMLIACTLSAAFLVSYLMHHAQVGSVPFRGSGLLRAVYLAILLPHVLLAAAIVPLVLFTLFRALTGRFAAHRRIARITLPLWLYVSVSGVVVYLMLYELGR
jgi:putative membrane protein